jgi:hypothetical protein
MTCAKHRHRRLGRLTELPDAEKPFAPKSGCALGEAIKDPCPPACISLKTLDFPPQDVKHAQPSLCCRSQAVDVDT